MQSSYSAAEFLRRPNRLIILSAGVLLAILLSAANAGAQAPARNFDSESFRESSSPRAGMSSDQMQFLEENGVAGSPSSATQESDQVPLRYDTIQFLEGNALVESDLLSPEQEADVRLDLRYDTIQFFEENGLFGSSAPNAEQDSSNRQELRYDTMQFLEENGLFGSARKDDKVGYSLPSTLRY
jgi:hypothetical protein